MLRRVARTTLFLLGTLAVLAMLLDCFADLALWSNWPGDESHVALSFGGLYLGYYHQPAGYPASPWWASQHKLHEAYIWFPLPESSSYTDLTTGYAYHWIKLPLWMIAVVCLAWPVTSFIIARRRHKRGFPVEPKGGGEAVSTPASSD